MYEPGGSSVNTVSRIMLRNALVKTGRMNTIRQYEFIRSSG
jgi:hypothetical protein